MLLTSVEQERLRLALIFCDEKLSGAVSGTAKVVKNFGSGLTNKSYLVIINNQHYVLRLNAVNSLDLGICRDRERQIHQGAYAQDLAPEIVLFSAEHELLLTRYIEGQSFSAEDFSCPERLSLIAGFLSKIHQLEAVEDSLDLIKHVGNYLNRIVDLDLKTALLIYKEAIIELLAVDSLMPRSICHNDLLADNFLLLENGNLIALDWEYASVGNPLFDLAVIIESQTINDAGQMILLQAMVESHGKSVDALSAELKSQRIIYRYIELLWFAVQYGHAPESIMYGLIKQKQNELAAFFCE